MRDLEQLCTEIRNKHAETHSWQKTADAFGINKAMARLLAQGYKPGKKIRDRLGLPEVSQVVVIFGSVPEGTQAIAANLCECGQWYIANHPRRKRCFVCSPYRRKDKK